MTTTTITSSTEVIRRGYDAFARQDIDTVLGILDPDIAWHVPGASPLSGDYQGHDQVLQFFAEAMQRCAGTLRIDITDVLASDDHVVVLCLVSAERDGRFLSAPEVHVWRMAGERAVEFREFQGDPQAEDEFWAS